MVALFMVQKMCRSRRKERISRVWPLDKGIARMLDITRPLRLEVEADDLFGLGEDLIEGHGRGVEDDSV